MSISKTRAPIETTSGQPTSLESYWSESPATLLTTLQSRPRGLISDEAKERLKHYGANVLQEKKWTTLKLLASQFKGPLVLILVFAALVSFSVQEWLDASIILAILLGSTLLGFQQEYSANRAAEKLKSRVAVKSSVLRDGDEQRLDSKDLVPGDVVLLAAGSLIPADGVLLESNTLYVNQAVLTGETFPGLKETGAVPANASLAERSNSLFAGTSVRSGTGTMLVVQTGASTIFGQLAERLEQNPESDFERGLRRFGVLLSYLTFILVLGVLSTHLLAHRPVLESLLFAIALAVGIAPELLPAIVSLTLAKGAEHMARHGVIVKRLSALENFGSMDVLCTDKTGTITEGEVKLEQALDAQGQASVKVLSDAALNAHFQTGLSNPLDEALQQAVQLDLNVYQKLAEIPYDFTRKRLSVILQKGDDVELISKGALEHILEVCTSWQEGESVKELDDAARQEILENYQLWGQEGFRVLGLAKKSLEVKAYGLEDEQGLIFSGFLLFADPSKTDASQTIAELAKLGVTLKIITGDNIHVARHIAEQVGLQVANALTGRELNDSSEEALIHIAERVSLFAEVDPNQKERIIKALQKTGHVVGYLGDGINDASALRAADVGISVDEAVDVAKEAADFVLLGHDLKVLSEGIEEGRRTFANTQKYIFITTSANFGNMLSMAGASLFLPFLPLLPKQILLNNFLSDFPALTIAGDSVDREHIERPQRWDIRFIRKFMVTFGLISSVFDYLTFGLLIYIFRATPEQFRTAWFTESLLTEIVVLLIMRTRKRFYQSRASGALLLASLVVTLAAFALPYLPLASALGFVALPVNLVLALFLLTIAYGAVTELGKSFFYRSQLPPSPVR
jgi:P-type Mg2+ transporter